MSTAAPHVQRARASCHQGSISGSSLIKKAEHTTRRSLGRTQIPPYRPAAIHASMVETYVRRFAGRLRDLIIPPEHDVAFGHFARVESTEYRVESSVGLASSQHCLVGPRPKTQDSTLPKGLRGCQEPCFSLSRICLAFVTRQSLRPT